jgi:pantoate--beta-alanine ligase
MGQVIASVTDMQQAAAAFRLAGKRIGLVPTMGALHEGHLSLIRIARSNADIVVTSVFVNPAQFGPSEDFAQYPRNLESDASLAFEAGADLVFAPSVEEIYPTGFQTHVDVGILGTVLEGRSRPGHFRGVATVVAKLFLATIPHCAVFGRKDAQQVVVIRAMVRDLSFPVEIIAAPIVRETDGLAMSSRNVYLNPQQRKEATVLHRSIQLAEHRIRNGERNSSSIIASMRSLIEKESTGVIDYISLAHVDTLSEYSVLATGDPVLISMAVRFGTIRLIDNNTVTV